MSEKPSIKSAKEINESTRELARNTIDKLREMGLDEEAEKIQSIITKAKPGDVLETSLDDWGIAAHSFKPMLELLLRDIPDILSQKGMPESWYKKKIAEVFDLSGYEEIIKNRGK